MNNNKGLIRVSDAERYKDNPFIQNSVLRINTKKQTSIIGRSSNVMLNAETGELEGITLLHKFTEVDKQQFVKVFVNEVSFMLSLSISGTKVLSYVISILKQDSAEVYIYIPALLEYCGYKVKNQAYNGLAELIGNEIIAMSDKPNIWYINPSVIFNGDRIAFIKEYNLKKDISGNDKLVIEKPIN